MNNKCPACGSSSFSQKTKDVKCNVDGIIYRLHDIAGTHCDNCNHVVMSDDEKAHYLKEENNLHEKIKDKTAVVRREDLVEHHKNLRLPLKTLKNSVSIPADSITINVVEDLLWFDGPLLSHIRDDEGNDFLYLWVDFDKECNRWMMFSVTKEGIGEYMEVKASLLDLIKRNNEVCFVDIDDSVKIKQAFKVPLESVGDEYLPSEDSFNDPSFSRS